MACAPAPTARWTLLAKATLQSDADAWRSRVTQCFRPTFAGATPAELAALERALHGLTPEKVADGAEHAIQGLIAHPADAAYRRLFVTYAREITQVRGGLRSKAVLGTDTFASIERGGKWAAGLPYAHFLGRVPYGFAGHTATAAQAAEDATYCAALRAAKGDAIVSWSGSDPALAAEARRNDAVVAARRGEESALTALPAISRAPVSLRDPCAP